MADKAFFINAYFDDLQERVSFLRDLHEMKRADEAVLLCCCYIEALDSRESNEPGKKAKNYCSILAEKGSSEIWPLIHPQQMRRVLSMKSLFGDGFVEAAPILESSNCELLTPHDLRARLEHLLNQQQMDWLEANMFKGSIANISYERIRSELVHDITGDSIGFSESTYNGEPVPRIDFEILFASLQNIVSSCRQDATATNQWWYERNATVK